MVSYTGKVSLRHSRELFIGGRWVAGSKAGAIEVLSSVTEEPIAVVAEADGTDVDLAVAAAREAFDYGPWPRLTPAERSRFLRELGQKFRARAQMLASAWAHESGVVYAAALPAIVALADAFDFYADLGETFPFVETHTATAPGYSGFLVREPVGVTAAIIPWNGPAITMVYKVVPALLAGCTVILKASPEAPVSAYILAEICEEIGLPPGVLNVLTADREVSERLVRHTGVDKVTFTGSTAAGRKIAAICGDRIARCTLELGGKSAAVILDDYDVAVAAQTIASRTLFLSGQVCAAMTRIIVPRAKHDAMVEALSDRFAAVAVGDPFDAATSMGPVATREHLGRIEGYIARGIGGGATLATGGKRPSHLNRGYFIEPTVFANVSNNAAIAREEIFGPVLSVIPSDNESHAIALANDTIYGLANSIFTNDPDRAFAAARLLRSGTVAHNFTRGDFGIAFGGFRQSGIGREGGIEGLLPFLEAKTVLIEGKFEKPSQDARA